MANNRLNATITIGGAISAGLRSAIGSAVGGLRQIGGAIDTLANRQRELNRIVRDQERLGGAGSALRIRYAQQEIAQVERQIAAYRRLQDQLNRNDRAREANERSRRDYRSKMGDAAAVGAAVILPAAASLKRSSEFNYQLQAIGNTADMSRGEIARLGVDILKLSDDTGKSAQDVQGAMGFLVAAGMEVNTARDSLRSIGRTATATASDIQDVAKASFTLNDALKIKPTEMQRALDVLVQSGKEGNFEFKDMAAELPVLGAAFQALKMTGVEATATLGAALQIARKGAGSSSQASTNTENFLAKLMSPETLKKAEKLGSDLYGVISKAQKKGKNPFEAAIAEISRVTKGGDQKLLGELFADMQVQNFLRPMLQNLDEYKRIKAAALGADGVTDRDFIRMSETTKQQLDNMGNAAGRAAIAIGSALEPAVGKLAAVLTPVVRTVTDFVNANQALVGNSILVVGGLVGVRLAALTAGYAWTFVRGAVIATQGAFLRFNAVATLYRAGMTAASVATSGLGAALMATPIGWVVAGIAAIAVGGAMIYKYWEPLKAFFVGFGQGLVAGLAPIGEAFSAAFAPIANVIQPVVMPVLETIGGWVRSAVGWFGELLTPIGAASETTAAFGSAGKACGEAIAAAFTFMLTPVTQVLDAIKWINDNIGGVIDKAGKVGAAISGGWQKAKDFVGGPSAPTLPPMRGAGAGAGGAPVQQTITNHITQLPGESAEQLARRTAELMRQQQGVQRRSNMTDSTQ